MKAAKLTLPYGVVYSPILKPEKEYETIDIEISDALYRFLSDEKAMDKCQMWGVCLAENDSGNRRRLPRRFRKEVDALCDAYQLLH
jgi:hypothetical protein